MPTRTRTRWILGLVGAWVLIGCTVQRPLARYEELAAYHAWPAPIDVPAKEVVMVGGVRFPHDVHAENDIGCTDCHEIDEETGNPGTPTWEFCSMCHEDMDEEFEKDEEKVRNRFYDADEKPRWTRAIREYDAENVIWGHKQHAEIEGACSACHAYILKPLGETPARPDAMLYDMAGCEKCHTERKAPNECATCHQVYTTAVQPPTHVTGDWRASHGRASLYLRETATAQQCAMCHAEPDFCNDCHARTPPSDHAGTGWRMLHGQVVLASGQSLPARCELCHEEQSFCQACHLETPPRDHSHLWEKRHGQMVRAAGGSFPARCTLCHKERAFCEKCHLDEPPASHTSLFRTRTHGMLAAMDRQTCATCHTTPFCVRCHQDTAPRSHRAGWSMGRNTHCVQCHVPITMSPSCRVCHQGNPTHSTAPPQPIGHVPGRNCRVCHNALGAGGARPLRHLDNGQNCESCHR